MVFLRICGLLLVFCCLTSSSDVFPEGHKWIYSYSASAHVGTKDPQTGWDFSGTLNVWSTSDKVYMKLDDVKTSRFNVNETKIKDEQIPNEAEMIEHLFAVNYVGAKVVSISVSPKDPLWSVNIKRAIAGVFQLDLKQIHEPASYIQEENVYGKCSQVEYVVTNSSDEVQISKNINIDKCIVRSFNFKTTTDFVCQPVAANAANAIRNYVLHFNNGFYNIKDVKTSSEKIMYSHSDKAGSMFMASRQEMHLTATTPDTDAPTTEDLTERKSLLFEYSADFSQGRSVLSQDQTITATRKLLTQVADSLHDDESSDLQELPHPNINPIFWMMVNLNLNGFAKLFEDIEVASGCEAETERNVFLDLLPYVGSHDSLMFIKRLIQTADALDTMYTITLLTQYPFYVKEWKDALLPEYEFMLDMKTEVDDHVKSVAVLSFSTLVHKCYAGGHCSEAAFEKYVKKFYALFLANADNMRQQLLYLHGLKNLQLGSVCQLLKPHVTDKKMPHHVRFLAVWALRDVAYTQPKEIFALFWPMLTDREELLEMRMAALSMLLMAEPNASRFLAVFWYMKTEPSDQLYNFYYTTIKSLHRSNFPCYRQLRTMAEKIVQYVEPRTPYTDTDMRRNVVPFAMFIELPPLDFFLGNEIYSKKTYTENLIFDYFDNERLFGMFNQMLVVNQTVGNLPDIFYMTLGKLDGGQILQQIGLYYKSTFMETDLVASVSDYNIEEDLLKKTKLKLESLKGRRYFRELAIQIQEKAIFATVLDNTTHGNKVEKLRTCPIHHNYQLMYMPLMTTEYFPTDFGTLMFNGEMRWPFVSLRNNITDKFVHETNSKLLSSDVDLKYRMLVEKMVEISNPLVDVFHGVIKTKTHAVNFGHDNLTATVDVESVVRISWKPRSGKHFVVFRGDTQSYMGGLDALLYNDDAALYTTTANPSTNKGKKYEAALKNMGVKLVYTVFGCANVEDVWDTLVDNLAHVLSVRTNVYADPAAAASIALGYIADRLGFLYPGGSCGLALEVQPLRADQSAVDFELRLNLTDEENQQLNLRTYVRGEAKDASPRSDVLRNANVTVLATLDAGLVTGVRVNYDEGTTDEEAKRYMAFNYGFHSVATTHHPMADFDTMDPLHNSKMEYDVSWGTSDSDEKPSVSFAYTCKISDEQKAAAEAADSWPFRQCKDYLGNGSFVPVTAACFEASKEMSTYRNYDGEVVLTDIPDWMDWAIDNGLNWWSLAPHKTLPRLTRNQVSDRRVLKITFNELVSMDGKHVTFTTDNKSQIVDYSLINYFELVNPKMTRAAGHDWYTDTCVISPTRVHTIDNKTIDNYAMDRAYVVLTQCKMDPRFLITMRAGKHGLDVNVRILEMTMDVLPVEHGFEILLNGKPWNDTAEFRQKFYFDVHLDQANGIFHGSGSQFTITHKKNHIVLSSRRQKICGICNLADEEYSAYLYEDVAANAVERKVL